MLFIYILIFLSVAGGGILKYRRQKELSSKLGREVEDHELVSLNSWIEAEEKATDKKTAFKRKTVDYTSANKTSPDSKKPVKNSVENTSVIREKELPNNCPNCGGVISKGTPRCEFCGTELSRKTLEENCAVFLFDLEKDFESLIPASHSNLHLGCFAIPVFTFLIMFFAGGFLLSQDLYCGVAVGAMVVSILLSFVWSNWTDKILGRRENELFDQTILPRLRQFVARNDWQRLEFLAVAKSHLEKDSSLLKQIHRVF